MAGTGSGSSDSSTPRTRRTTRRIRRTSEETAETRLAEPQDAEASEAAAVTPRRRRTASERTSSERAASDRAAEAESAGRTLRTSRETSEEPAEAAPARPRRRRTRTEADVEAEATPRRSTREPVREPVREPAREAIADRAETSETRERPRRSDRRPPREAAVREVSSDDGGDGFGEGILSESTERRERTPRRERDVEPRTPDTRESAVGGFGGREAAAPSNSNDAQGEGRDSRRRLRRRGPAERGAAPSGGRGNGEPGDSSRESNRDSSQAEGFDSEWFNHEPASLDGGDDSTPRHREFYSAGGESDEPRPPREADREEGQGPRGDSLGGPGGNRERGGRRRRRRRGRGGDYSQEGGEYRTQQGDDSTGGDRREGGRADVPRGEFHRADSDDEGFGVLDEFVREEFGADEFGGDRGATERDEAAGADPYGRGGPRQDSRGEFRGDSTGNDQFPGGPRRRRRRRGGRGRGRGQEGGGPPMNGRRGGEPMQNVRNRGGQRRPQPQQGYGRDSYQNRDNYRDQSRGRPMRQPMAQTGEGGGEVTGTIAGVLELHPKGFGFLRDPARNYLAQDSDPFVSGAFIEKNQLREGVMIRGDVGPGTRGQGPRLKSIESIDGRSAEDYLKIKKFEDLTPINPFEQIKLETGPKPVTMRVMDLLCPIGKGQRALIVAPPRSGKTMLLQDIADSVSANHPELQLLVVLIDERPEEVTEMRRRVRGEVIASSMDRDVDNHIRVSKLIFERAKRLVEAGGEVFVLLDSVTRLARAFNKGINTGRTGTGGLDVKALEVPRQIFGTARRFDEGGSLTVVATALVDTGSRMDDAIFQEFKGTGNMELVLSRDLADRRIWPAMDISMSGTRREEKILSSETLNGVIALRRSLVTLSPVEAMEQLIRVLERYPTNAEFLAKVRNVL